MKKTLLMFQKNEGLLRPAHFVEFEKIQEQVDELGWCQAEFGNVKKPKSNEQLGWLYAKIEKSGIYEFMMAHFLDKFGDDLYEIEKFGYIVHCPVNIVNVDIFLKELYCNHKGIKEFNKTNASTESMTDYIKFLDNFSINNFGECLPEPKKEK